MPVIARFVPAVVVAHQQDNVRPLVGDAGYHGDALPFAAFGLAPDPHDPVTFDHWSCLLF